MGESLSLVSRFLKVAEADAGIARILAQKKQYTDSLAKKKDALSKQDHEYKKKKKVHDERKTVFAKEERFLKEEREKISDRRKGLSSHNNYKVQQAAERELDYVAKQINLKEETLIKSLTEIEEVSKEVQKHEELLSKLTEEFAALQKEHEEQLPSLEERLQKFTTTRQELLHGVDPSIVIQYDRVRAKYPMDPLVAINEQQQCSGCFMQIGPQILQQVHKASSFVKCPGCARILFLPNSN